MKYIVGVLIWLAYWLPFGRYLNFRGIGNAIQRRWKREHKDDRSELFRGKKPQSIRDFAVESKYKWREDATRVGKKKLLLDWVSHPKVFQARMEKDPFPQGDGDCDDYHNWFAACLRLVPGTDNVMVVSVGYPKGGHTVCAYAYEGKKYLVNYRIQEIADFNEIPDIIAKWGTKKKEGVEPKVTFYVFEKAYPQWKLMACGPKGRVKV
jgi:hypothetical protein